MGWIRITDHDHAPALLQHQHPHPPLETPPLSENSVRLLSRGIAKRRDSTSLHLLPTSGGPHHHHPSQLGLASTRSGSSGALLVRSPRSSSLTSVSYSCGACSISPPLHQPPPPARSRPQHLSLGLGHGVSSTRSVATGAEEMLALVPSAGRCASRFWQMLPKTSR